MRKAITVRGVVQGVGFRPFVYRLAHEHGLAGWVLNHSGGVEIEVEGPAAALAAFVRDLEAQAPPLARIEGVEVADVSPANSTWGGLSSLPTWGGLSSLPTWGGLSSLPTFEIRHSVAQAGRYQLISPDIATCPDCLRELLDPADRRYRYPFTNCTNCGPRFTIIADVPYDRPLTTMRDFVMCPLCQAEYDDPLDRRFHAQPNACPACGPHVWLTDAAGHPLPYPPHPPYRGGVGGAGSYSPPIGGAGSYSPLIEGAGSYSPPIGGAGSYSPPIGGAGSYSPPIGGAGGGVLAQARDLLLAGKILAIKGLGGFHLACDATDEAAVRILRERKDRPARPLAVMMATLEEVKRHCWVAEEEEQLLVSSQCPIVLLPWKPESNVSPLVAPRNHYLGVMLPYTPLHHVLLRDVGRPLVMTSGNLSEEPIARDNDEALRRLAHLADYFLLHNRGIYARYDDSVWFVPRIQQMPVSTPVGKSANRQIAIRHSPFAIRHSPFSIPQPIRRARGYAPFPVKLPFKVGQILACGAELKNTFCITRDEYAFLSQHIGDMENLETLEHFEATVELYKRLFRIEPHIIAHDLHPEYLASKYAQTQIANLHSPFSILHSPIAVQHDHAHIASCLADNGWPPDAGPVIGLAWDGTGYGTDGHIWGGEFLVADYFGFQRVGHLEYLPMPGGEMAIRHPYRLAIGYLYALTGQWPSFPPEIGAGETELHIIQQQIDRGINCPQTSAGGRLFDAVSALLGIRDRVTYEAQAAIELEMAAQSAGGKSQIAGAGYPYDVEEGEDGGNGGATVKVIRLGRLFEALLADRRDGVAVEEMAYRFHVTVAEMMRTTCERIAQETGLHTVALSGGCFQNRLLLTLIVPRLREAGLRVLLHRQVPCNDGGISLGQAVIAHFAVERRSKTEDSKQHVSGHTGVDYIC